MTRDDAPDELERGQTVYLYLYEVDDDAGDPEDYLGRFPAGTEAVVQWVSNGSLRGLDVEVEVTNDDGEVESFSVRRDEIATSLRTPLTRMELLQSLRESIHELRLAESEDAAYPF